jgi:pimeloyl-ACP methyl ester carboxylesterase
MTLPSRAEFSQEGSVLPVDVASGQRSDRRRAERIGHWVFAGACLAAVLILAARWNVAWWLVVAFAVAPDVAVLAGLAPGLVRGQLHPRAVRLYNGSHRLWGPAALGAVALIAGLPRGYLVGAVAWALHVGFDRALGLRLRTPDGFQRQSDPVSPVAVVTRYRRDLAEASRRLAGLKRQTIQTRWGELEYCEWGEGPPLLLIHGVVGGCDVPPSWRALVPGGYRIITPSRFGYLGSPLPKQPTVAAQADAYVALLDALGIAAAPVLAFSAGSTSAILLALSHPERVSGLVLVAANSPHEKPVTLAPRPFARLVFAQPTLWFLRAFLPDRLASIAGTPADYELDDDDRRTLETIFDSFFPMRPRAKGCIFDGYVGNPDIGNYPMEHVTVPTMGVHAPDDPLASYDDARAMVARIPGSCWFRVQRGGHIFVHKDQRALEAIADFLEAAATTAEVPPSSRSGAGVTTAEVGWR